ncbi:(d)CMP kinase [Allostreptomyces psammosilenae]|uniref:Cytidylate kinase n=1 Tax=Allostreptomyces psammosilenae TaxID=1892865 RepID=A0A852ZXN9_9ACTN|nr:(d)CMP kinase [Allostreptomyces psammosilenae]NYI03401.1 cytidylate kinase [Allostreptomyces psammosilenae]
MHSAGPSKPLVVAVDGTSGSGKSSVSKQAAHRLGLRYLDTGAMYRAMTWWMLQHGVDVDDAETVAALAGKPEIVSGTDPLAPTIVVDGQDVAEPIRTRTVTNAVSAVSAVPEVRHRLVAMQRLEIERAAASGGIVVEGRDIGTVVAPHATAKLYLTASPEARAARRSAEINGDPGATAEVTRQELLRRDAKDSGRKASPLAKAGDAEEIDTTELTLEEVVERAVETILKRAAVEG